MSADLSSLAAKSASHSLKRSRILYDVNAQSAFLPAVDPAIMALSVARRKRRIQPNVTRGSVGSSTALALVADSEMGMRPGTSTSGAATTSTALIRTDDPATVSGEQKPGGILVVRRLSSPVVTTSPHCFLTNYLSHSSSRNRHPVQR